MRSCLVALTFIALMTIGVNAAERIGIPRVVDGDTLTIAATRIRLQGIDAPETDQICLNASGDRWTCGIEARDRLIAHIAAREISCISSESDVYGRELGHCSVAGEDLNGWMVHRLMSVLKTRRERTSVAYGGAPLSRLASFGH